MKDNGVQASSGVEALIEKLREQGVKAGQQDAARLVEEAEHRADWLVQQARQEAEQILQRAKREADHLVNSGQESLKVAARDIHLEIGESLAYSFTDQVERLVAQQMQNEEFMRRLLLELVGSVRRDVQLDEAQAVEVLLPERYIGLEELRRNSHEYRDGKLSQFVQSLAADQLREGVSIQLHDGSGIKVRLVGQEIEVDLSEGAVAKLLLKHLQPRFRAMLEGVIR